MSNSMSKNRVLPFLMVISSSRSGIVNANFTAHQPQSKKRHKKGEIAGVTSPRRVGFEFHLRTISSSSFLCCPFFLGLSNSSSINAINVGTLDINPNNCVMMV